MLRAVAHGNGKDNHGQRNDGKPVPARQGHKPVTSYTLTFRHILVFGTIALPLGMIGLPIAVYLAPLYSGELGIGLGVIGAALIGTRLLDVVTDPLIGIVSDRWRPKIGRRRIWLILGTATLMAGIYMLFLPGPGVGPVYFIIAVSLAYFGLTTLRLPYTAWAAELSPDYHMRTRVSSTTQFFGIAGLLASTLIPAWIAGQGDASTADIMRAVGIAILIALPIASTAVFFLVPEPDAPSAPSRFNLKKAVGVLLANGPFVRITLVVLIATIGETVRQSTTVFFARDLIGIANIGQIYFYYFVAGLIAVPLWVRLAKRIEKHRALTIALLIVALTNAAMIFLSADQTALFTLLFVIKGVCFGAVLLLPLAMLADAVDVDTAETLDRQQGLFFSAEAMVQKLGVALGAGIPLILLSFAGYNAEGETSAAALQTLSLIYGLLPAAMVLCAAMLTWNYSLTAERHSALRAEIERRAADRQ